MYAFWDGLITWLRRLGAGGSIPPVPVVWPPPAPAPPPVPVPAHTAAEEDAALFAAVNAFRASAGHPPYAWHAGAQTVALGHATVMGQVAEMSHDGLPDGPFAERTRRFWPNARTARENIAEGFTDPAAVVTAWRGDAGHLGTMLAPCRYAACGYAVDGRGNAYWDLVAGDE